MMKKTWKTKWLKALRSGRYKQTTNQLCSNIIEAYCCLGVLCKVGRIPSKVRSELTFFDGNYEVLSKNLLEKFGLTDDEQHELSQKNDDGVSFESIANYIEKEL